MQGKAFLVQVLDEIERRETGLLVWGVVDGFFQREELIDLIDDELDKAADEGATTFTSAEEVLVELVKQGLVFELPATDSVRCYRSRMAEAVRLLLYKAYSNLDEGKEATIEACGGKYLANEVGLKAASNAMKVHGAWGLAEEYKVERYFRDARAMFPPEGNPEIQNEVLDAEETWL